MAGGGLLSLKWNQHKSTFLNSLSYVKQKELYSDMTLACDGKFFEAHKLVLSTCSEYFEGMFTRIQCKHPVIVLKDISCEDLESLLSYMYDGEVNVLQENLSCLIKAAECLKIKGLAVPDTDPKELKEKSTSSSRSNRNSGNVNSSNTNGDGNSKHFKSNTPNSTKRHSLSNNSNPIQLEDLPPTKKRKYEHNSELEEGNLSPEPVRTKILDNKLEGINSDAQDKSSEHSAADNDRSFAQGLSEETGVKAEPIDILDDDCEELTDTHASDDRTEYDGPNDALDFTEEKYAQDEDPNSLWGNLTSDTNDIYGQANTSSYTGNDSNFSKPGTSNAPISGTAQLCDKGAVHRLLSATGIMDTGMLATVDVKSTQDARDSVATNSVLLGSLPMSSSEPVSSVRISGDALEDACFGGVLSMATADYNVRRGSLSAEHLLPNVFNFGLPEAAPPKVSAGGYTLDTNSAGERVYCCVFCPYTSIRSDTLKVAWQREHHKLMSDRDQVRLSQSIVNAVNAHSSALQRTNPSSPPHQVTNLNSAPHHNSDCANVFSRHGMDAVRPNHQLMSYTSLQQQDDSQRRVFMCSWPDCGHTSTRREHYRIHIRKHTGEKPFLCTVCDYRCNQKGQLKNHMLMKHSVVA